MSASGIDHSVWITWYNQKVPIAGLSFNHARNVHSYVRKRIGQEAHLFIGVCDSELDEEERTVLQDWYLDRISNLKQYLPHLEARIAQEPYPFGGLVCWISNALYKVTHLRVLGRSQRRYGT